MNVSNENKGGETCNCDYTLAFLVLRAWLAVRAILTGIEKFAIYQTVQTPLIDQTTGMADPSGAMVDVKIKSYALTNYAGIPQVFKDKFAHEPMMPAPMLAAFEHLLGPVLIGTGVMLLLGIGTRISLFIQGIIYIMLTIGFILIRQEDGISQLAIHLGLVAFALTLAQHNKLALLKKW